MSEFSAGRDRARGIWRGATRAALFAFLLGACAASPAPGDRQDSPVAPTADMADRPAPAATEPVDPAAIAPAAPPEPAPAPVAASGKAAGEGELSENSASAAAGPAATRKSVLDAYLRRARSASCADPKTRAEPEPIELSAAPITLGRFARLGKVGELTYVAGYELNSPDARFGGVSGLVHLVQQRLLAVTDQGDMLWIDLDETGVEPVSARMAPLHDLEGRPLTGKATGDAEGLAILDGLALVSFERDHRVLAFDIAACGATARGAPVANGESGVRLSDVFAQSGLAIGENAGPEALAATSNGLLLVGLETRIDGAGPVSVGGVEAAPVFDIRIGRGAPELVGLDVLPNETGEGWRAFSLHRGFGSGIGPTISLNETAIVANSPSAQGEADPAAASDSQTPYRFRADPSRRLAVMGALHNIDNFEGIAVRSKSDGGVRIFIVSDDNFSARQRTLLMVFDLSAETR